LATLAARSFRKDTDGDFLVELRDCPPDRGPIGATAIHLERSGEPDEASDHRNLHEFPLRHEVDRPRGGDADQDRVGIVEMIAQDEQPTASRNVVNALDPQSQHDPAQVQQHEPRDHERNASKRALSEIAEFGVHR